MTLTTKPETVAVEFTREEFKSLRLFLYGTDFSDINPVFQAACDKIEAAWKTSHTASK